MRKFTFLFLDHNEISKDLILLLTIGGLYSLGIFLSNTFVNVYLWRQTNDFMTISTYNFAIFLFQPITFIAAGKLSKKIDRIIVLRLGVIFLSLFFITVLIMGKQAGVYQLILGSLLGIGYGFYWLAFNVLTFEITEPETRDFFNGFMGGLESLGGMIGPLLAGIIIANLKTNIGYMTVFSLSLLLFILAIVVSFFIHKRDAFGYYELKTVAKEIKFNSNWRNILFANMFQGMREGLFIFVIAIWVFLVTKSEFSLGIFNLCLSGFSFLFYFIVTKIVPPKTRKIAIFISSTIISFSIFILLFKLSFFTLIIYAIVVGSFYPVLNVPLNSMAYDVIGKSSFAKELRIEYMVILEVFTNIGRLFSVTVFMVSLIFFQSTVSIPIVLTCFSLGYLFIFIFIRKIQIPVRQ